MRMAAAAPSATGALGASLSAVLPASPSSVDVLTPRNTDNVKALEKRLKRVVEAVSPGVVAVESGGSGVVVSGDGFVLCVAHVGQSAGRKVVFTFPDGRKANGVTLGNCKDEDAALMKITDPGPWPYVDMGRSAAVAEGQWCLALSYPVTFEHGRAPVVRAGRVLRNDPYSIVSDCAIMGGDSGGPLFDLEGKVIGISATCNNSLLENRHIPVDRYRDDWDRLAKGEDYNGRPDQSALLGLRPDANAKDARIGDIVSGSPADVAGLQRGDVIIQFDGQPVHAYGDLRPLAAKHHPGCTCDIEVVVRRGATELKFHTGFAKTELGKAPKAANRDNERNGASVSAAARPLVARNAAATVRIMSGGKAIAMGTVVDPDGYIVSKASLLQGSLVCRWKDGRELEAKIVGGDLADDLALLRVDARRLPSIQWRRGPVPPPGSIVIAPGASDDSTTIGVVSADQRKINGTMVPVARQGWLGVSLRSDETGVIAESVVHNSPADRAGLRSGDRIRAINGQEMTSPAQVTEAIRSAAPGSAVKISVRRDILPVVLSVTLGRQSYTGSHTPEDGWGGGPFSERRWGFPFVLPHDIAVAPDQCGGPLLDTDGKAVGINIARALRVSTFALSADTVKKVVGDLIAAARTNVASERG